MELLIVLLLVVLLVCVLVLFVYLLNQGRRSESINAQLLAKNQEALTVSSMADQKMVSRFDSWGERTCLPYNGCPERTGLHCNF